MINSVNINYVSWETTINVAIKNEIARINFVSIKINLSLLESKTEIFEYSIELSFLLFMCIIWSLQYFINIEKIIIRTKRQFQIHRCRERMGVRLSAIYHHSDTFLQNHDLFPMIQKFQQPFWCAVLYHPINLCCH